MPAVTVIIPAFNQCQYLSAAIKSVLRQSFEDLELVVVDDGSTDATREVTLAFSDARLRYIYQQNRGLSAARNTGIRQGRGRYLTFLDSDDEFLPDKLAVLLSAFDEAPELGFVAGQAVIVGEDGRPVGEVFERGLPADPADLLLGNPLHVGSVLLRREWQERVGFFDEHLRSYEDWDMWLRLAHAECPMRSVAAPVALYRFHGAQMTRLGSQMTTATFAVLNKFFDNPNLPEQWRSRRDIAYSRAHLRAAAQAFTAHDVETGRECLRQAVRLHPSLSDEGGAQVAALVAGWANHAKTREPLAFLAEVYDHLPSELASLRRRRSDELAREALHLAFSALAHGNAAEARACIWRAAAYRPSVLAHRGTLSILLRRARGGAARPEHDPATAE